MSRLTGVPPAVEYRECDAPTADYVPLHMVTVFTLDAIEHLSKAAALTDAMARWMRLHDALDALNDGLNDARDNVYVTGPCTWAGNVDLDDTAHGRSWYCPRCGAQHDEDQP